MGEYGHGPVRVHCTAMVATVLLQLMKLDIDLAGYGDGELKRLARFGLDLVGVLGVRVDVQFVDDVAVDTEG